MKGLGAVKVFSMLFGVVYSLCFYYNWALFRYYPEINEFHYGSQPKEAGPAILWYGWLAAAALVSAAVSFAVPRKWADDLWVGWSWVVPTVLLIVILVYEKRWFV